MSSGLSEKQTKEQAFNFCRITRDQEGSLGRVVVQQEEIRCLAEENLGVYAGGYRSIESMDLQLSMLARSCTARQWVVAASTKNMLTETMQRMRSSFEDLTIRSDAEVGFRAGFLRFTTVEALALSGPQDLEGVILFDPACHVHRARSLLKFDGTVHDRPQLLVDFLAEQRLTTRASLFCLMSRKPPRSVGTSHLAQIYMLDGWLFADPYSLSFVDV